MIFKWEFRLDEQKSPQNNTKNNVSFCGIFVEYLWNICWISSRIVDILLIQISFIIQRYLLTVWWFLDNHIVSSYFWQQIRKKMNILLYLYALANSKNFSTGKNKSRKFVKKYVVLSVI